MAIAFPKRHSIVTKSIPLSLNMKYGIFTIQLEDAYSRGLEIACSAFSELSQKFDVIGGKIFAPNLPFSKS